LADTVKRDYRQAPLSPVDRALCGYAYKLTKSPVSITDTDISRLHDVGLSDRAINDAVQVIAYFNYINRVADGLGVDLEPGMPTPEHRTARSPKRDAG
jgi:uncharacterized peroxidase-related enzyme